MQGEPAAEVVVEEQAPPPPASARRLDRPAIEATPARSAQDLLRAMPGLHTSSHGGQGKAAQLLIRGVDAVHGGDVAASLAGLPLNEPSNVHAHGYLDLHALPTALVREATLRVGPYDPSVGDFGLAGSVDLDPGLDTPGLALHLGAGSDLSGELGLAWRPAHRGPGSFALAEWEGGRGVGEGRDRQHLRVALGVDGQPGGVHARAWVLAHDGRFGSPGALRAEDVEAGRVDLYAAWPGPGGGRSRRVLGGVEAATGGAGWAAQARLGGWARDLTLDQDFTGFLYDPVHGDATRQSHAALGLYGQARARAQPLPGLGLDLGLDARGDALSWTIEGLDRQGEVHTRRASLDATQGRVGAWLGLGWDPLPALSVDPALRVDLHAVQAESLAWAPALSPRLVVTAAEGQTGSTWLALGRAARSPDARSAGEGRAPLAWSNSAELGQAWSPAAPWRLQGAAFGSWVGDELVFDHVSGRVLPSGTTRRVGLWAAGEYRPLPALTLGLEGTVTRGRFVASGEPIPTAPPLLLAGTVTARALTLGTWTCTGGLWGWFMSPRPLPGGFTSQASGTADLRLGLARGRVGLTVEVENLPGLRNRDGEFFYASRPTLDDPASTLPVRHITAAPPRALHLSLELR